MPEISMVTKSVRINILLGALLISFGQLAQADDAADLSKYLEKSQSKTSVIKQPKGLLKHEYLVPAGPYAQLFDWDAYFMGVALSYDGVVKPLAGSAEDFLDFVGKKGKYEGYIPREIAPDGLWTFPNIPGGIGLKIALALKDYKWIAKYLDWVMLRFKDLTPPSMRALPEQCKPFIAQMIVRAAQTSGDYAWAAADYDQLKMSIRYWENSRKASDGLFLWHNGLESGTDNTVVVSNNPAMTTEGVDLQVYMDREYQAMALIAEKLGKVDEAKSFHEKSESLRALINLKMWSEEDGFYYNIDSRSGKMIHEKTWVGFTPLWGKIASSDQAKRLIGDHLLSPLEFWAPHGVRTLAKTSQKYDPKTGYWRGPIWVISNYISMHGLMNYGFSKEALELANKTQSLLVRDIEKTGSMNEAYNPETGSPTANGDFLSWNLLAEHMVDEAMTGKDPAALTDAN
jgi:putative isomerase